MKRWRSATRRTYLFFLLFLVVPDLTYLNAQTEHPRVDSVRESTDFVTGEQGYVNFKSLQIVNSELAAAQEPFQMVTDDRVAEAFNFVSDQFRVSHPQHLTGTDVLQFRIAMSAIYPHVFNSKSQNGSRPVSALILLHQLVFNGGVPQGAKNLAQTDPQPGSRKIDSSRGRIIPNRDVNIVAREYQGAGSRYFRALSNLEFQHFVGALEQIMGLPDRR